MDLNQPLAHNDPAVLEALKMEERRQSEGIELIASENYTSRAVLEAMGTVFCNKYSEGYPGKRYYGGNEVVDIIERLAIERAKELFDAEHVNVQPLSGGPANTAVYLALLQPGDTVLGMALDHGGHLSHGMPLNISGQLYNFVSYGVEVDTGRIDMDKVRALALEHRPKMIVAGFSAYPRDMDWKAFQAIADEVGAITMADIAHIAGLIAGKQLENPTPIFDVVTTTTHKSLRGPRGAIIMSKKEHAKAINRAVFPGLQGGPHDHINAAKAVCFKQALDPDFVDYARQTISNAQALANALMGHGFTLISQGTDNHLMLIDLMASRDMGGKQAVTILDEVGISTNMNMIPHDTRKALDPSGLRLGTPAITTRGMKEPEMEQIASWINDVLSHPDDESLRERLKSEIKTFCLKFPVPGVGFRFS